jgi:hypothetical protein
MGQKVSYVKFFGDIDTTHMRMLVRAPASVKGKNKMERFRESLYSYKRLINFYEKVAGWSKTLMTRAKHPNEKYIWLLTGPGEWMKVSYTISMFALIMRLSLNDPFNVKEKKSIEKTNKEIEAFLRKLSEGDTGGGPYSRKRDLGYLEKCWNKLFLVIRYYDELFGGMSLEDAYKPVGHSSGGIVSLCTFNSAHPHINTKFRKICQKHGI